MINEVRRYRWLQVLRILSALLVWPGAELVPDLWALPLVIWATLNFAGLLVLLPILFIIGLGAGAAQADWMSDSFEFIVFIAIPTAASIIFASVSRRRSCQTSSLSV
ncbi:hypothetical protein HAHE_29460 [Haloferula helveola]|uniref:Uncharacterized protein n=1 Tax=Haloferula helveola TaxID=490095 RepID=A0ABM7RGR3_9BACT|nr:hypothetical protein HAHE_29460 [Haloferula helveola]